jgi:hypothetical protein
MKNPPEHYFSNPEVAAKHFTPPKWLFCKHEANCFTKIIRQEPSGPAMVKQIRSPLVKASPPLLPCRQSERFWAIHQL